MLMVLSSVLLFIAGPLCLVLGIMVLDKAQGSHVFLRLMLVAWSFAMCLLMIYLSALLVS